MIRYADDFADRGSPRRRRQANHGCSPPKRMSKYVLTVHPEKTRLVWPQPGRQADDSKTEERDPPEPRTFDFLGFTHYWG